MAQRDPLVEYQREGGAVQRHDGSLHGRGRRLCLPPRCWCRRLPRSPWSPTPMASRSRLGGQRPAVPTVDRAGRHLVESGPDPDGPGVAVHAIDDEALSRMSWRRNRPGRTEGEGQGSRRRIRLAYPAQLLSSAEDGSVRTTGKPASKADNPYANVGCAPCPCVARSSRCVTGDLAPFSFQRNRLDHSAGSLRTAALVHEPLAHHSSVGRRPPSWSWRYRPRGRHHRSGVQAAHQLRTASLQCCRRRPHPPAPPQTDRPTDRRRAQPTR